jgi:hypothetical protein
MKNYNDFVDYINMLASEFKDSGHEYLEDYAHACADGSEYVIYYGKAWDLVNLVRSANYDLFNEGAEYALELGTEGKDADETMSLIAYGIIYSAVLQAVIANAVNPISVD